ncbi:MAG: polyhydroxybutyrate depolymerase [Pseudomonadota bacterium]
MRWTALLLVSLLSWPAMACGPGSDCVMGERTYRIAMPEGVANPGALVYAHGYRGTASGAMRNNALIDFAHEQGMAFVAIKSFGDDWHIPGVPADPGTNGAVELAYIDALMVDLSGLHGIDTDNIVMSGFSAGAMMTWFVGCKRGDKFRAFLPVSGTFWKPIPQAADCPGYPFNLVHIHGTADQVVPIAGRPIGPTHQGNVQEALERLIAAGDYDVPSDPDVVMGELACRVGGSPEDRVLGFCTHPGGHSFKVQHLRAGFEILRARGALPVP